MNSPYNNAPPPLQSSFPAFGKGRGTRKKRKQQDYAGTNTNKKSKVEVPYSQVSTGNISRPTIWNAVIISTTFLRGIGQDTQISLDEYFYSSCWQVHN